MGVHLQRSAFTVLARTGRAAAQPPLTAWTNMAYPLPHRVFALREVLDFCTFAWL